MPELQPEPSAMPEVQPEPSAMPEVQPEPSAMPAIQPLTCMENARELWIPLAARTDNIFSSWEWADTWWRHFGDGRTLRVAAVAKGASTSAILPIYTERRAGLRIWRFLGHGVGDQLGPVCDRSDAALATAALAGAIAHGGVLLAERMPKDRDWAGELNGRIITEDSSPVIDVAREGSWEDFLGARSANFRQQVRRRSRKLQSALGLRFRLAQDRDRLQADLASLIALHRARWGARSTSFRGPREAFHREFATRALERGWLRLWIAEADGAPVAAWYGFRFAGVESYYQSGRDPAWDRYALGAAVLEHSIREAFADGMREYRLLRGDEAYKSRYATYDRGLCTILAARRRLERSAIAAAIALVGSETGRRLLKRLDRSEVSAGYVDRAGQSQRDDPPRST